VSAPLTQSEVATLLQCGAKWSFAYSDLAGFPIRSKVTAPKLREGRAWGAAVQAWHTRLPNEIGHAPAVRAHEALMEFLNRDAQEMDRYGALDEREYEETRTRMSAALVHYMATATRLNLVGSEVELDLPHADGWTYRCHLDGVHQDEDGYLWVVEFKWRPSGRFTNLEQIVLWRQVRWYALALANQREFIPEPRDPVTQPSWCYPEVRGVIVDERLGDAPNPVRFNKNGSVSATQSCLLEEYLYECEIRKQSPHPPTVERLKAKTWQQRHEVLFREDELDDALRELEAAETLVRLYRSHALKPIRHPGQWCSGCQFLPICADPSDVELRNALYEPNQRIPA
jgi:hypothetical protein